MFFFLTKRYMDRKRLLKAYNDVEEKHKRDRVSHIEYIKVLRNVYDKIGEIKPTRLTHPAMLLVFPLLPLDWLYQKCYDKYYLKPKIKKKINTSYFI